MQATYTLRKRPGQAANGKEVEEAEGVMVHVVSCYDSITPLHHRSTTPPLKIESWSYSLTTNRASQTSLEDENWKSRQGLTFSARPSLHNMSGIASKMPVLLHHNLSYGWVKLSRSVCFFTCAAGPDEQSFPPSRLGRGRRECREGRRVGSRDVQWVGTGT